MRFLIVASILACASAVPSQFGIIAPAVPTISAGDINGAAIEAHVEASDHLRAAVDANRQLQDKVNELHGQAVNKAEENAWRVVDDVKTAEARLDGAAAAAAPVLSKQLVGKVAPVAYTAPVYSAPVAYPAPVAYSAPLSYPAPVYSAPVLPYSGYPVNNFYGSPVEYSHAW